MIGNIIEDFQLRVIRRRCYFDYRVISRWGIKDKPERETHGKGKRPTNVPAFTSRMEKREFYKNVNHFDIRNVLDVKGFLNDIRANWNTYVSQVSRWIQKNPIKRLVVTGIFTVALGISSITSNAQALIEEYTYQVKSGEKIENIAGESWCNITRNIRRQWV